MPKGVYKRKPRDRKTYQNSEEFRESNKRRGVEYYRRLRAKVVYHLGGKCSNPLCSWLNSDGSFGCTVVACLQIDHKNGGGVQELKKMSAIAYLNKVLHDTEGLYQLLCANCNWIKRLLNGEDNKSKKF